MTAETVRAVTRMCDRIWTVCPWAAPTGWVKPAPFDFEAFMADITKQNR